MYMEGFEAVVGSHMKTNVSRWSFWGPT